MANYGLLLEYIDQAFADQGKKLYPEDPAARAKARAHITFFGQKVAPLLYKVMREPSDEDKAKLLDGLAKWVEEPLTKHGSAFLGGQEYNTVDINIWPWIERFDVMLQQGVMSIPEDRFPNMMAYMKRMKSLPGVAELLHTAEEYRVFFESYKKGEPNYNYNSPHPLYEGESGA